MERAELTHEVCLEHHQLPHELKKAHLVDLDGVAGGDVDPRAHHAVELLARDKETEGAGVCGGLDAVLDVDVLDPHVARVVDRDHGHVRAGGAQEKEHRTVNKGGSTLNGQKRKSSDCEHGQVSDEGQKKKASNLVGSRGAGYGRRASAPSQMLSCAVPSLQPALPMTPIRYCAACKNKASVLAPLRDEHKSSVQYSRRVVQLEVGGIDWPADHGARKRRPQQETRLEPDVAAEEQDHGAPALVLEAQLEVGLGEYIDRHTRLAAWA